MMTEGSLNNGDPTGYAQGLRLGKHRGLRTVGHSGSSWGFRTELVRFVEPGLSIAISCNFDSARPGALARSVAEYFLADQLEPESEAPPGAEEEDTEAPAEPPSLSSAELAEFTGSYYSDELDATYRFAVQENSLAVRIEQESTQGPVVTVARGDVGWTQVGGSLTPLQPDQRRTVLNNARGSLPRWLQRLATDDDLRVRWVDESPPRLEVYGRDRFHTLVWFATAGRMSLTNYVMQSAIGIAIFYGCGGGLWGRIGVTWSLMLIAVVFGLQTAMSHWWLRMFRHGPLEWIWRCLTYRRLLPLRNDPAVIRRFGKNNTLESV